LNSESLEKGRAEVNRANSSKKKEEEVNRARSEATASHTPRYRAADKAVTNSQLTKLT